MIIRKFVAKTENEATAAAKKELGEGMVIMNVRYVKPKGFLSFLKKKQVELTAAKEDDEEPIRQIATNAGLEGSVIVDKIVSSKEKYFGFDAAKMEYGNITILFFGAK